MYICRQGRQQSCVKAKEDLPTADVISHPSTMSAMDH